MPYMFACGRESVDKEERPGQQPTLFFSSGTGIHKLVGGWAKGLYEYRKMRRKMTFTVTVIVTVNGLDTVWLFKLFIFPLVICNAA